MQDSCKWVVKVCSKNRFNEKLPVNRRDLICTPACRFYQEHNKVEVKPMGLLEPIVQGVKEVKEIKPVVDTPHRGRPYKK
jgi:hypothetical protein